ncbi:endonuclease domain-containing protein, partial [Leclercia adecarboxylata]|uniref:endonuclease domain-containing protein n=1 Tax=Leclercia adecarboxylata TaxID=83655 RepID=UPI00234D3A54
MRLALTGRLEFDQEHRVGRHLIDFALVAEKVAIEVDGAYWHDPVKDARRDAILLEKGWRTVRFGELEVRDEPHLYELIVGRLKEVAGFDVA